VNETSLSAEKTKRVRSFKSGLPLIFLIAVFLGAGLQRTAFAFDTFELAESIAASLNQVPEGKYTTIAFSRIQGPMESEKVNEIIDFAGNEIVQGGRFRLIDRSKLQLILQEQKFNISGMVSQDTYKELGLLLGVDLFVYGRYYVDIIVLKAIDVESSAIVWADVFQLTPLAPPSSLINDLSKQLVTSLHESMPRLKDSRIGKVSFWNIRTDFDNQKVIDLLSVALTQDGSFQVVDRENLQLILEEQKLNMEDFIDEQQAKRMGELYGVDAFIYGSISSRQDRHIASLKLLNIYSGVIEWAKTIRLNEPSQAPTKTAQREQPTEEKMIFIPSGTFVMGTNSVSGIASPEHKVSLPDFYIDRIEVSNAEYREFVTRYKHRPPPSWQGGVIPSGQEDYPVVTVSWADARRYCQVQRKRLPTEAEWEKAFRGENGALYPWQEDRFHPTFTRTIESAVLGPEKVFTINRDVSPYGVQHMAGNVREWVDAFLLPYTGYQGSTVSGSYRVIRGGSWAKDRHHAVGWYRDGSHPNYGWEDVGFRCARSAR
jgi:formylglycine-generating enzyme